ncbi:MAG: hypothetical protein IT196_12520 [Acidimicrobiales bacterium]|nr:hypothetical protein [Acidimicrobiales bacterium]
MQIVGDGHAANLAGRRAATGRIGGAIDPAGHADGPPGVDFVAERIGKGLDRVALADAEASFVQVAVQLGEAERPEVAEQLEAGGAQSPTPDPLDIVSDRGQRLGTIELRAATGAEQSERQPALVLDEGGAGLAVTLVEGPDLALELVDLGLHGVSGALDAPALLAEDGRVLSDGIDAAVGGAVVVFAGIVIGAGLGHDASSGGVAVAWDAVVGRVRTGAGSEPTATFAHPL